MKCIANVKCDYSKMIIIIKISDSKLRENKTLIIIPSKDRTLLCGAKHRDSRERQVREVEVYVFRCACSAITKCAPGRIERSLQSIPPVNKVNDEIQNLQYNKA